jgi:phosphoribosylformylglycinamidine synthase
MFGEDQGRYLVTSADNADQRIPVMAEQWGVPCRWVGMTGGDTILIGDSRGTGFGEISLDALRRAHEGFLPKLMGPDAALA